MTTGYLIGRKGGSPTPMQKVPVEVSECPGWAVVAFSERRIPTARMFTACQVTVMNMKIAILMAPPCIAERTIMIFTRSEEHTSELQSRENLVCRPLLEKKHTQT